MRLHRHDELVNAIARAMQGTLESRWDDLTDDEQCETLALATVALDALLEAAVRLEVGQAAAGTHGHPDNGKVLMASTHWNNRPTHPDYFPALILRMEASDDK